ncbi:MAG TPA: DUF3617 family protein [Xanthobacteraceae bacterium]|nr:DUF3617 family protein [Xanthobacteraceae bacterium]
MTSLFARMLAVGAALSIGALGAGAADGLEPGLWKIVTRAEVNAMPAPDAVKTRCLKADDARDLERTFAPEYRVEGATCERMDVQWSGQKLSWRVHCAGALSMDVTGTYEFDTPRHYSGVVTLVGAMAGREVRSRTLFEGERIGECEPEIKDRMPEDKK